MHTVRQGPRPKRLEVVCGNGKVGRVLEVPWDLGGRIKGCSQCGKWFRVVDGQLQVREPGPPCQCGRDALPGSEWCSSCTVRIINAELADKCSGFDRCDCRDCRRARWFRKHNGSVKVSRKRGVSAEKPPF